MSSTPDSATGQSPAFSQSADGAAGAQDTAAAPLSGTDARGRVRCVINGKSIFVWPGYRLWDAALDADARLWQACGGNGQCTTCAVLPLEGAANLTPPTRLERFSLKIWFLKPLAAIRSRWKGKPIRLACQAYVRGPVEAVGLFGKTAKEARKARGLD